MNESAASSKFTVWKRPIIGGLLSALIAGVFFIAMFAMTEDYIDFDQDFLVLVIGIGFYLPIMIFKGIISLELTALVNTIALLFWFLAGALISKFIKTNKYAMGCWLLLYVLCFSIAVLLGFLQQ